MSKYANFTTIINNVQVDVRATVYEGEIDEFTVYVGGVIVTEILNENIVKELQQKALYEVSNETTILE